MVVFIEECLMHALGVVQAVTLREYAKAKMKDISNYRKKKWNYLIIIFNFNKIYYKIKNKYVTNFTLLTTALLCRDFKQRFNGKMSHITRDGAIDIVIKSTAQPITKM
jgi:hypothetical protein